MEYTTIIILAFLITTWSISKVQFGSTLFFLFNRLLSIINLRTTVLELLDMTFGLEKLAYALSVVKPLAGPDFRFTIPTALPSEVDLFISIAYLVNLGCMCYLSWNDDIRFTKVSRHVLNDFFSSPVLPTWQSNYLFYGLTPVNLKDFLCESPAQQTNPLDSIFKYPVTSTPVCKLAPVVSVPPSSTPSVSAYAGLASLKEPRRIFGMVIPAECWQPKVITLADLEIDDGSYLRDALGMSHSESLECGFWPEVDEYVPRRSNGQPGRWYTDTDEVHGWIFPGRGEVPEFVFEPIAESDWDAGDNSL
ncbi:hypothetical protein L227DRAFT_617171 [Lentinus tigrinus ALCF2SS1-6]|uniref:Uncharacterized protein n=1 Tax=Lentinus tigrinus ALCF2SS1-6 TaxID=1328759 RepID=A0A5C2RRW2_9APHY|nr:hypothetical protein L227DRAFT_617171 [Lentinus tigrinus ALCF2SS1-6]